MTSIAPSPHAKNPLSLRQILRTWWPLAASWLLMTTELPLISAIIARLPNPEQNLAAWGVVFALSIIIQSPSTMILAASTALSKDWASYRRVRRFTIIIAILLTTLHFLIAFTPLYDVVAKTLLGLPEQIFEPVRVGLMIMVPWSFGTAYRRFQQGVLIRFDNARAVVWGSLIRVGADIVILTAGYLLGGIPGIVVGTGAIITGVLCEAAYTGFRVRPVVAGPLRAAPPVRPALTFRAFMNFYVPLALTVLLMLLVLPLVSAALSRMPNALQSLAVWPVVMGFLLMWQSAGLAYNEAVIALLDKPQAERSLRRFTAQLTAVTTIGLGLVAGTPLTTFWFTHVAGLSPPLVELARQAMWLGLLLPGLKVLQSWYQGAITYGRRTRGITEAFAVSLLVSILILWAGMNWGAIIGLYVGLAAVLAGNITQALWLWQRARPVLRLVRARDATYVPGQTPLPAQHRIS